jgi:GNAT superfamily N-acetyltransferase
VSWFRSSRRRSSAPPQAAPEPVELAEGGPPAEPEQAAEETAVALAVASPDELVGRPLADLHALARQHGVPRYRMLRKEELIEALTGEAPRSPAPAARPERRPTREPQPAADREPEPEAYREPDRKPGLELGLEAPAAEPAPRRIIRVSEVSSESVDVLDAVQRLVRQLSPSAQPPGASALEEMIGSPATRLLVARDEDEAIVGMLTLAVFRIPSGVRAWIEDVVVDESARGGGVGEALTREAIRMADESGARTVDLTSRREREAANRMYRKVGFARRPTTVYRIEP